MTTMDTPSEQSAGNGTSGVNGSRSTKNLESNGGPRLPDRRRVLPFFRAADQRHQRGSLSASITKVDGAGRLSVMLKLYIDMMEQIAERQLLEVPELDDLSPLTLTGATLHRLLAPELEEPSGELPQLRDRGQLLKSLRAKRPTRQFRELQTAASDLVTERVAVIRRLLEKALEHAPHRVKELAESVEQRLDSIRFPESIPDRILRFENCVRGLAALAERRLRLPNTTVERATTQLRELSKPAYCDALREVVQDSVNEILRNELKNLQAMLAEFRKTGGHFLRNQETVRELIETEQGGGFDANIMSPASIVLSLTGPSEEEVFAGMFERHHCGDRRSLAAWMLQRFEGKLRERARVEAPALAETGTLGTFLIRLSSETVADAYINLFVVSLGDGHSLYEIIERANVRTVARELWERSAPLCHLSDRDIPEFNITPYSHAVVRLPKPVGPRDGQIKAELARALEALGHCTLLEAETSEKSAVSVVRILAGWPIVIEAANDGMLQHYAKCDDNGHPPHLVGLFSGSDAGLPRSDYVKLARYLDFAP